MLCSREQFEKDLRKPLEVMGYDCRIQMWPIMAVVSCCTEYLAEGHINMCYGTRSPRRSLCLKSWPFILIKGYQPDLFLALAAMSDEQYGVPGEWWVNQNGISDFTVGKLYKSVRPLTDWGALIDNTGMKNGNVGLNLKYFRKATIEEIFKHLSKSDESAELSKEPEQQGSEEPWTPKNGDNVMAYSNGGQVTGTYIGWDDLEKVHVVKVGIRKLKGFKSVYPCPTQENVFKIDEPVFFKLREDTLWNVGRYGGIAKSKHLVFPMQTNSETFDPEMAVMLFPVEILKITDIPF